MTLHKAVDETSIQLFNPWSCHSYTLVDLSVFYGTDGEFVLQNGNRALQCPPRMCTRCIPNDHRYAPRFVKCCLALVYATLWVSYLWCRHAKLAFINRLPCLLLVPTRHLPKQIAGMSHGTWLPVAQCPMLYAVLACCLCAICKTVNNYTIPTPKFYNQALMLQASHAWPFQVLEGSRWPTSYAVSTEIGTWSYYETFE